MDNVDIENEKVKSNRFKHKEVGISDNSRVKLQLTDVWHGVQEWIRQEIVDDDPYDEESFDKVDRN